MEHVDTAATLSIDLVPSALPASLGIPIPEKVGQAYDSLANGYDDFHVDAKSLAENALIADRVGRRIGSQSRVLDLGCGTGLLLDLLGLPADGYVGVDVSERMLKEARQKHPEHTFIQADAQRLDPDLGQFDLVVSLFGSPSYCGLAPFARSVERMLKPGGGHFLMYCGPRYVRRSTYINKSASLLQCYDTAALRQTYPGSRVWGMSCAVDAAPKATPFALMRGLLAFDVRTAGHLMPDLCFFLVVER